MSRRKNRVWGLIRSDGEVVLHDPNQKEVLREHKKHNSIHTGIFECVFKRGIIQTAVFGAGFPVTSQHHVSVQEYCRANVFGLR